MSRYLDILMLLIIKLAMSLSQGTPPDWSDSLANPVQCNFEKDILDPDHPGENCEKKYTFRGEKKGMFVSPGFPENYPERTTCCYLFIAARKGRVKIYFDYFDLEGPSEHGCKFDYVAVSSLNDAGVPQPKTVYCGSTTPPEYVSAYSRAVIMFHSDFTKNANGFLGHYEFLDANWHPFRDSTVGCGPSYLTGHGDVIASPNYPDPYPPEAGCTWVIKVDEDERILINILSLDITSNAVCKENVLMIFDGFITPEKLPVRYCGQLDDDSDKREILSDSSRVTIRFESGPSNSDDMAGFKAVWTAVRETKKGECEQFECVRQGTGRCPNRPPGQLCNEHHFCIDKSLECNEVSNCGAFDDSDENKCLKKILLLVLYVAGPIVAVVTIVILAVCCYKKHRNKGALKYSMPVDNTTSPSMSHSMASTQSSYMHVRSLDHSPRNSCVMYTTSFTDCSVPDSAEGAEKVNNKLTNNSVEKNSNKELSTEDGVALNYKGHRKRASYHMMRELCYEDGNIIIADI